MGATEIATSWWKDVAAWEGSTAMSGAVGGVESVLSRVSRGEGARFSGLFLPHTGLGTCPRLAPLPHRTALPHVRQVANSRQTPGGASLAFAAP